MKCKRVKSMQPDSECKIRIRAKPSTPKDSNPKSKCATNLPKRLGTGGIVNGTSSFPSNTSKAGSQNSEDDYDNKKTVSKVRSKINNVFTGIVDMENIDSPATRFLKKVESNTMTPLKNTKSRPAEIQAQVQTNANPTKEGEDKEALIAINSEENKDTTSSHPNSTRRTLAYPSESANNPTISSRASDSRIHLRRRSTMNVTRNSCVDMSLDQTLKNDDEKGNETLEAKAIRKDMSCMTMTNSSTIQRRKSTRRKTIHANKISPEKVKKSSSPNRMKTGHRRRTVYAEKSMEIVETPNNKEELQGTIYTPQNMEESHDLGPATTTDDQRIDDLCASLSTTRIPEQPLASSTIQVLSDAPEEKSSTTVAFDSARKPGRRRSLFDVSMDIISERLQNINRSARRSTINPTVLPTIIDETQEVETASKESDDNESSDVKINTETQTVTVTCTPTPTPTTSETLIKKKRKLFAPNNNDSLLLLGTPPPMSIPLLNDNVVAKSISYSSPRVQTKRRRTLMPLSQPCTTSNSRPAAGADDDDDDDANHVPATAPPVLKSTELETQIEKRSQRRSTMDFDMNVKKTVKVPKVPKPRPLKFMVATNMHKTQKEAIAKALQKLGVFGLDNVVNERTTHVVTLEPRRTINLLRGLTRGLWILEFPWITDSLKAGFWQEEEAYELRDFSQAIKICRAERQAFGNAYSCELFATLGGFYISASCGSVNKNMMEEFLKLGGGLLMNQRQKAKYIICNVQHCIEDKIHITPKWVLDSITQMQLQPHSKYQPVYKGPTTGKGVLHRTDTEKITNRYMLQHQRP